MKKAFDSATKLNKVLDSTPGALEYIIGLNPHDFSRLNNPIMRKYMTPRITLKRVAAMAEIPANELVNHLNQLAGYEISEISNTRNTKNEPNSAPLSPQKRPAWLKPGSDFRIIDVLDIDDAVGDPLPPIIAATRRLQPGEIALLKHRWEPQPLYDIWTKTGFEWFTERVAHLEWYIYIYRPLHKAADEVSGRILILLDHLNPPEIAPRCATIFDQLAVGEWLEIASASKVLLEQAIHGIRKRRGSVFSVTEMPPRRDKMAIKVRRTK